MFCPRAANGGANARLKQTTRKPLGESSSLHEKAEYSRRSKVVISFSPLKAKQQTWAVPQIHLIIFHNMNGICAELPFFAALKKRSTFGEGTSHENGR